MMIRHSTTLLLTALAANVPRYSAGFIGNSGSFLSRSMPSFMNVCAARFLQVPFVLIVAGLVVVRFSLSFFHVCFV